MPTQQTFDSQDNLGADFENAVREEETLVRLVDDIITVARRLFASTLQDSGGGRTIVKVSR